MTTSELAYAEIEKLVKRFESLGWDTSNIKVDAEIDKQVYALYGLTEDEIKIVEGS